MSYLYASNLDSLDRRTQLEIQLDTGDTSILRMGHFYDLTVNELARARRYIVLTFSGAAQDEEPIGVVYLPMKGNPTNDQIPQFSTAEGAFVPSTVSGVSGGPYASVASVAAKADQSALDSVEGSVAAHETRIDAVEPYELLYTNLALNPSAELDTTWWESFGGGVLSRITSWSASGTAAFRVAGTGTDVRNQNASPLYVAAPGDTLSVAAELNVIDPGSIGVSIALQFFTSAYALISGVYSGPSNLKAGTGTGRIKLENVTAPATTAFVQVVLRSRSAGSETHDFYSDSIILVKSATVPSYFDGDTANAHWNEDGTSSLYSREWTDQEERQLSVDRKTKIAVITNPIGIYAGAVGDGITDNTAVIQAWVDWVEANLDITQTLFVPSGEFVTAGISTLSVSIVGEKATRSLLGSSKYGSKLIHKAGSTIPLIDMLGGGTTSAANAGWESVENLVLQGRQKQNITQPKRPIVSATDRTHFTVAIGHLPSEPNDHDAFPYYGLCLFLDANGDRLGSGIVRSINTGTGQVTLAPGTDNYTGKVGSGNLLTNTEQVVFSGLVTYGAGWTYTVTNAPDSTMIGPCGILVRGVTKKIENVDLRDFHCSIVLQENILHIGTIWSHNHVMAGLAIRATGTTSDIYAQDMFFQGRKYQGMIRAGVQEPAPTVPVIDAYAAHSLCGMWGLSSTSHYDNVTCEAHMHSIIDAGGKDIDFDYLNSDGTWKEPIVSWEGSWEAGVSSATISVKYLQVRTLQAQYGGNFTAPAGTYISGALVAAPAERTIISIPAAGGPRRWAIGNLVANRFASDSPAAFDFASVYKIVNNPTSGGAHEVSIGAISFQGAVTTKGIPRGQSALVGKYCLLKGTPVTPGTQIGTANVGRTVLFEVDQLMPITQIKFPVITAATTDDPIDGGILDAAGNRIVSSGATTGKLNSTGVKSLTIATTILRPGVLYQLELSYGAVGGTAATIGAVTPAALQNMQLLGTAQGQVLCDAANSRHPIPSTKAALGGISSVGWLGAVLE